MLIIFLMSNELSKSRPIIIFIYDAAHASVDFLCVSSRCKWITWRDSNTKNKTCRRIYIQETGWRIFLSSLPNYNLKLDLITKAMKSQTAGPTRAFLKAELVTGSEVATQIERLTTCERAAAEKSRDSHSPAVSRAAINLPRARSRRKFANANGCCLRCAQTRERRRWYRILIEAQDEACKTKRPGRVLTTVAAHREEGRRRLRAKL